MPNGYTHTYPKVERFQDESGEPMYECRVKVMDLAGQVVSECRAVNIDSVDAERRAVEKADAFMRGDRGPAQR
jgi:hypothetical protein